MADDLIEYVEISSDVAASAYIQNELMEFSPIN